MRRALPAVALAALAGCGGQHRAPPAPTPTPVRTPAPEAELQRLLDRRAATTLATRAARPLGLSDVRLKLERARIGRRSATLAVRLSYGARGVRGRFGAVRTMRARRTAGRWVLTGLADGRRRAPWETDRYTRLATGHFVVWLPRGLDPGPLPTALADGYARMRAALPDGRLRRRYLVVVARDAAAARRMTARIRGVEGLTALTDTEVHQEGPALRVTAVTSQRLLIVWPAFSGLSADQQRTTIAHELTHAVLAPATSGRTPGWLGEGLAMYVSGDRRSVEATAGQPLSLRALSRPDALGRLHGDRQAAAYAYASAAAFFIADRYGRHRLLDLYDAFNREDLPGRAGPRLVDAATRRVLHVPLARLERELRAVS